MPHITKLTMQQSLWLRKVKILLYLCLAYVGGMCNHRELFLVFLMRKQCVVFLFFKVHSINFHNYILIRAVSRSSHPTLQRVEVFFVYFSPSLSNIVRG